MNDDVLFEITRENLDTGLRGYPVGHCPTSYVEPTKGLFYMGKPIAELAYKQVEWVIYLLLYGREPTGEELHHFQKELKNKSAVLPVTLEHIQRLPRSGHPLKLFSAALLIASMIETKGDYREDALKLIAIAPTLVATIINHHAGWGSVQEKKVESHHEGYVERFLSMLNMPKPKTKELVEAMTLFSILHFDHGGGNLSTFVGKAVASGLEDLYGSMAAAMCALAGPRHGRANQDCLEFVLEIMHTLGQECTVEQIEALIRNKLKQNELVFGFGHAVLRVEDPRATIFYELVKKRYSSHPLVQVALKLRQAGTKVLAENPKVSDPYPNVDAISGIALIASGFDYPEYFPLLFGLSRTVGIAKQIVFERCEARGGKGTPIVRPKYFYVANEELSG